MKNSIRRYPKRPLPALRIPGIRTLCNSRFADEYVYTCMYLACENDFQIEMEYTLENYLLSIYGRYGHRNFDADTPIMSGNCP